VHLTSEEERLALRDLGLDLAPTAIIPNGVDAPVPFSHSEVSPDVRALAAERFDILSFGRISWKKGLDRLIRAMVELPNARALIAGNDEDGLTAKLQSLAEGLGVGDRVRVLPRQISGADKEALFAAARLFVLPSLSENFGNVVAEAMIRCLPVVVTERVGAAEIVKASGGGLIARSEPEEFAAVLAGLLSSNERMAAMGAAGEAYAQHRLTWTRIAGRFEELYTEIIEQRSYELRRNQPAAA
jgi:glycosyltransferase involved in cell wall biosynthesis